MWKKLDYFKLMFPIDLQLDVIEHPQYQDRYIIVVDHLKLFVIDFDGNIIPDDVYNIEKNMPLLIRKIRTDLLTLSTDK